MCVCDSVQVIGSPISLKNRYGSGWTISIGGHGAASPELLRTLRSAAPSAAIDSAESDESDVETPASGRASASLSDLGLRQSTSMSDLAAAASVVAAATSVHVPRDAENELLAAVEVLEASEGLSLSSFSFSFSTSFSSFFFYLFFIFFSFFFFLFFFFFFLILLTTDLLFCLLLLLV